MKSNQTNGPARRRKGGPGRRAIVRITEHYRRTLRGISDFIVRKGHLKREARGLALVREPEDEITDLVPVPILARVAAGQPPLRRKERHQRGAGGRPSCLEEALFRPRGRRREHGGAGIHEGDIVIVRQQPVAEGGEIVVALPGDEAPVSRLYIREGKMELRPEKPKHRPIPVGPGDDLRILGKMIGVRRLNPGRVLDPEKVWLTCVEK